jgi:hypothetical protein
MRTKFFLSALILSCLLFVASAARTGWAQDSKDQNQQQQQQQQNDDVNRDQDMDLNRQNNQDNQDVNRTETDMNRTDTDPNKTDTDVKATDNFPQIDKKGDDAVTTQEKTNQQIDTGQQVDTEKSGVKKDFTLKKKTSTVDTSVDTSNINNGNTGTSRRTRLAKD